LTRSVTDFFAGTAFLGAAFRATAFFTAVRFVGFLRAVVFEAVLLFATALTLVAFLGAVLRATARVAFSRFVEAEGRRFAADFGAAL
jgi:hypothetical protein